MNIRKRRSSDSPTRDDSNSNRDIGHVVKDVEIEAKPNATLTWTLILSLISATFASASFVMLRDMKLQNDALLSELATPDEQSTSSTLDDLQKPRVWIEGKRMETGYLRHVIEIFDKLGYKRVNGSDGTEDWDVLWAHDYPFATLLKHQLQPHQRVNHFPGSGFITNKVSLATTDLKDVPKAFHLPRDKDKFLEYVKSHPDKLWVKKSNAHRGIQVEDAKTMNLDTEGTFVQEFIYNPLLIDGKKFDVGIYVMMTSVDPLRVYFLASEALLRFCAKPYLPFNSSDLDSYVVGDDYTPVWDIPSLKPYFKDTNLNMKESLNAYLRDIGKDPDSMWKKIEGVISDVYIAKAPHISKLTSIVGSPRHFFEMVRFDFVVDEDLNVYVMEANMSPNLSSSHFAPNKLLYEQVVYNILSVAGIANTLHIKSWMDRSEEFWNPLVGDKDLTVFNDLCASEECRLSCASVSCRACLFCLSPQLKTSLKDAVLEHHSRWNMRRLIPSQSRDTVSTDYDDIQKVWFDGKCLQDIAWCS